MSKVLWITGLSGAGKSTLSNDLVFKLKANDPKVIFLDGDELRDVFSMADAATHARSVRIELAMRYAKMCKLLASQGMTIVIATISMFKEVHQWNRENLPGYIEIYLKVPPEELRKRDPKGIYKKFDNGEIKNVAGLDLIIDEPTESEIVFDFDPKRTVSDMSSAILKYIEKKELV